MLAAYLFLFLDVSQACCWHEQQTITPFSSVDNLMDNAPIRKI